MNTALVKRFTSIELNSWSASVRPRTRPTIIDVARIAGVSPTTVSYVLSGPSESAARISAETTTRILDVVDEVGYVPNQSARTLRLRRTNRILFLGNRLNSLYSQGRASAIEATLAPHGLGLNVQIGSGADAIERAITMLDQNLVDGLIAESGDSALPALRTAAQNGHAIVAVGPSSADPAFDVISSDYQPAILDAMRHAVDRGRRHFVLLSTTFKPLEDHRVGVAYQELTALGVTGADITLHHCPHDSVIAYRAAGELLQHIPTPAAVYGGSDVSAIGVLWACLHLNLRVPKDISIIGHGNNPETEITVPPLTSIGPIHSDFGRAAELMAARLKDPSQPGRHITEPCRIFIRSSS